jgi:hypothetical protein
MHTLQRAHIAALVRLPVPNGMRLRALCVPFLSFPTSHTAPRKTMSCPSSPPRTSDEGGHLGSPTGEIAPPVDMPEPMSPKAPPSQRRRRDGGASGDVSAVAVPMDTLPDELLLHVFSFVCSQALLTVVPGVCRRWRRLCGDTPGLHLVLNFEGRRLGQHANDAAGARMMSELAQRWRHAIAVSFVDVDPTDTLVTALASLCPKLARFASGFSYMSVLGDIGVVSLAVHCPRLATVDFGSCPNLTDVGMVALAEKCKQLVSITAGSSQIQSASVVALAKHCPLLTSIDFSYCWQLTNVGALASCTQLTNVNFSECEGVTDADVINLAKHCAKLTSIDFAGCSELTDNAVVALAEHCLLLFSVNFERCAALTDGGVIALATHCSRLRIVTLGACVLLTSGSVLALVHNCPLLTSVDFEYCELLTDSAVVAVAKHASLDSAIFVGCPLLTNGAVVALAAVLSKNPTVLRDLDFYGCSLISEEAIVALTEHCPQLRNGMK